MKKDKSFLKLFVFVFFVSGISGAYILISKDAPYDPIKTYDFVEYTQGTNALILRSGKRIFLWGIKPLDKKERNYREVSLYLNHKVAEKNVSFLEMDKENQQVVLAKAFLSDGRDISRLMIQKGWVKEDCIITKGSYGTCKDKVQ